MILNDTISQKSVILYYTVYPPCPTKEKYKTEHNLGLKLLLKGLYDLYHFDPNLWTIDALESQIIKNKYGKPSLKDFPHIHFNISHCDGQVICAFSTTSIGIDIECITDFLPSIIRRTLTDSEKKLLASYEHDPELYQEVFFRFWTLKESRIKEAGMGLSMPLTDFSFNFKINESYQEHVNIHCSQSYLHFHQQFLNKKTLLAICCQQPIDHIHIISSDPITQSANSFGSSDGKL